MIKNKICHKNQYNLIKTLLFIMDNKISAFCTQCRETVMVGNKEWYKECNFQTTPSVKEGFCPNCINNTICQRCGDGNSRTKTERHIKPHLCLKCYNNFVEEEKKQHDKWKKESEDREYARWEEKLLHLKRTEPNIYNRIKQMFQN